MARRSVVALALGISALMLWGGLPLAAAHTAPSPSAQPHPAAFIGITVYNAYGDVNNFSPGPGEGYLYFRAVDSALGAATGTVTIVDTNATRDGVPSVAATWAITFNNSVNDS